jgi:hypothetical protein
MGSIISKRELGSGLGISKCINPALLKWSYKTQKMEWKSFGTPFLLLGSLLWGILQRGSFLWRTLFLYFRQRTIFGGGTLCRWIAQKDLPDWITVSYLYLRSRWKITYSTMLKDHWFRPARRHRVRGPGCCYKSPLSRWPHLSGKIQTKSRWQTAPRDWSVTYN